MAHIKKSALVPYSQQQMYELVNRVELYPDFIPWCHSAKVLNRSTEAVEAELCLAQGAIKKSFTTRNHLQPYELIELRLVNGPFKHLEGHWRFRAEPTGCQVCLDLEFEFSSSWLAVLFSPVFHQAANSLVDVFCKRAQQLYGPHEA